VKTYTGLFQALADTVGNGRSHDGIDLNVVGVGGGLMHFFQGKAAAPQTDKLDFATIPGCARMRVLSKAAGVADSSVVPVPWRAKALSAG
jgi:hypothetical protein